VNEIVSDRYWVYFTAIIYWALVVCWLAIVIFYWRQYGRFKRIYPLLTTLLIVLMIDGTRTLIESLYFGARYTSQTGLMWPSLFPVLYRPYYVAIPKGINLVAALIIILVIVGRWFRSLEDEMRRRRVVEKFRSELLSLASHEMRTPLTSIRGYANTLLREFGNLSEETQKEFLEGIASESERLSHLVSDLLDMSQIDEGRLRIERRAVAPESICQDALAAATHPELKHEVRLDVAPDLPVVLADPARIHQVMANLVSNAIKFSPEGGEIVVGARRENDFVEFFVRDQGVGIAREEQTDLFSRFRRGANAHNGGTTGAGLGLYITKGIVDAHGGTIAVDTELGAGSTFRFTLPTIEGRVRAEEEAYRPTT
jgi:signal transduction histidine kinase